mmetsp:Transcript_17762/g.38582  ORF Transcript_17762/g.38582 Transcript_17762/m.38582 type:complete len:203 (-) Transcript_17762:1119-1727(-)
MVVEELGGVEHLPVDHDPAVVLLVVLGHVRQRKVLALRGGGGSGGGLRSGGGGLRRSSTTSSTTLADGDGAAITDVDVDRQTSGDMSRDLIKPTLSRRSRPQVVLEEVACGGGARNAAEHHAVEERGAPEPVLAMHAAAQLPRCVEAADGLCGGGVARHDLGVGGDVDAAHGVVDDGGDDGDVEVVVHAEGKVVEELLAEGT